MLDACYDEDFVVYCLWFCLKCKLVKSLVISSSSPKNKTDMEKPTSQQRNKNVRTRRKRQKPPECNREDLFLSFHILMAALGALQREKTSEITMEVDGWIQISFGKK